MQVRVRKRSVSVLLSVAILLVALLTAALAGGICRGASATDNMPEYEIYPLPHSAEYGSGFTDIPSEVSVSFGAGIDGATKKHTFDALSLADTLAYVGAEKPFKVYVGIAKSGDAADTYATAKGIAYGSDLFTKNDAYLLSVASDAIVVLGKDTDAAYYGVTTLGAVLEQAGNKVRSLKILDFSDSVFRGFIEGYYGIPWTTEERIELMKFGGKFKTNIYIYAPKDDPYHSANWRGLYSPADLAELKEQIAAGAQTKTRFAWAIHPFLHAKFTDANFSRDLNAVLNKFEQLYSAGVRQFVVSADDVDTSSGSMIDGTMHRDLLNNVCDWLKEKGDCYDLIFVPSAYCYKSEQRLGVDLNYYYKTLTADLDPSVYIMWTGDDVCSTVASGKFDEFTQLSGRKAFMWLNWPVNDYAQTRLLMGKGEVLNAGLSSRGEPDFYGIVTNPMQLAEPSKPSIFAIADYCWNINGFDADNSYSASFKYIERVAAAELYALCGHLANATPYEGEWFAESEDIAPLVARFTAAYNSGDGSISAASELKIRFERISSAADDYLATAENQKLKNALAPWVESLDLLAQACSQYLDVFLNGDATAVELRAMLDYAAELNARRENCKSNVLNVITYNYDRKTVDVAPVVLTPFLRALAAMATDEVALKTGAATGNIYGGFDGIYQGEMQSVTDGDDSTFVWFDGYPAVGAYVRVDLGELVQIRDVRVLTGKLDGGDAMTGRIEYSLDGRNYTRLGALTGAETIIDIRNSPVSARFIRLYDDGTPHWVAVREVSVNTLGETSATVA